MFELNALRRSLIRLPSFRQSLRFAEKGSGDSKDGKTPPAAEAKPDAKTEQKAVVKAEVKPEVKAEVKAEEKPMSEPPKKAKPVPKKEPKPIKMLVVPFAEIQRDEDTFEHNERIGRYYSPHMTIYEPQLTSILSFAHRIAGTAVSGYFSALGLTPLAFPHEMAVNIEWIESLQLSGAILSIFKILITLPFAFHMCNGLRHLVWDAGKCLTIPDVYKTGYIALGVSVVMSVALAIL